MNNYPYYNPYGGYNPQQYQEQYRKIQQQNNEKRQFRKRSMLVALGIILFLVISYGISFIIYADKRLGKLYLDNTSFSLCFDIITTVVSMFGAYLIIRALIDRKHTAFIPLGLPENKKRAFLLVPFGILACISGSYATYYMDSALESIFNVTFTQPEISEPKTPIELGFYLMASVLVPCIFEEIALRAGALEALRKYGDWFAIIASAFVFAILHGNMVQTPFAFVAGVAIGYIYVVTGSIWPGVAIHFINNLASCSSEIGTVFGISDAVIESFYGIYLAVFVVAGTVCFIIYLFDKNRPKLNKDTSTLTLSQKITGFIINVPMIASILYMGFITSMYIERK
ncbi:MAG: CPBP family intramembrane metalloprotease [Clostridia bacterium]|nr:CPBP family intramembrane metalloprotease [Clostridia bacterium]